MQKLFVSDEEYAQHKTRCLPVPRGESVKRSLARTDPVYFVVNQLGLKPYVWQAKFLDSLASKKPTLACTGRQIGKTATIAWFALWACTYNVFPTAATKKTRIVVVSKTEGQALKVISDIREFMRIGDDHLFEITNQNPAMQAWFTNQIAKGENTTNTKSMITFTNGCQIVSLPPTDAARGYTGSWMFMDEVAFIPDDIITNVLLPIVSSTGNKIAATSTPNGKQGWFYKNFDPDDQYKESVYERIWCPYDVIRQDDPERCERKDKDKQMAIRQGEERSFLQEYEADFTASETGFFGDEDITRCINDRLDMQQECRDECDMGIDFGKKVSRTVITITKLVKEKDKESKIRLIYQHEYGEEKGIGQDLVDDVERLLQHYNIQRMVVEDCPASSFFQHAATMKGWQMTVFNPTAEKNKQYYKLRAWMRQGKVEMPNMPELLRQMRGLVVVQLDVRERIEHGNGLRDDCIDSFMMATYHMTTDTSKLRVLGYD